MILRLLLILAVLGGGLVWTGVQLQASLRGEDVAPAGTALPEAAPDKADFAVTLPPAVYEARPPNETALLDRAVFEPTRKRPAPPRAEAPAASAPATATAPAPQQELTARILGTILQDGKDILVMQTTPSAPTLRISVGDAVQGWELVEITSSGAKFQSGERITSLELLLE
ncbi:MULTISPECIES: hypothetical protein [unclassified Marinovum]